MYKLVAFVLCLFSTYCFSAVPYWQMEKEYDDFEQRTYARITGNNHDNEWLLLECTPEQTVGFSIFINEAVFNDSGPIKAQLVWKNDANKSASKRNTIENWWLLEDPRHIFLPYEEFDSFRDDLLAFKILSIRVTDSQGTAHDIYINHGKFLEYYSVLENVCRNEGQKVLRT